MNKTKIIVILATVAIITALLVYYFLLPRSTPKIFGAVNQKKVVLSSTNPSAIITTQIVSGSRVMISVSTQGGSIVATFQGSKYYIDYNTTFMYNPISTNMTNTLTITGFGSMYSLTINFLTYNVSVVVNGNTLTNSNPDITLSNVTTLNITVNSAPNNEYNVKYEVECGSKIMTSTATTVTTNSSGSTTFSKSAPTYSSCSTTYTFITITGPGISDEFAISVDNHASQQTKTTNNVSFTVTIS